MVNKETEGNKYQFDSKDLDKLIDVLLEAMLNNSKIIKISAANLIHQISRMIDGRGFDSNDFISRILEQAKKLNKEFFSNDNCYR